MRNNLSENQINWIFGKVNQFTVNNREIIDSDEYWENVIQEAKELHKRSRKDKLCKELLLTVIKYFEEEAKEGSVRNAGADTKQ